MLNLYRAVIALCLLLLFVPLDSAAEDPRTDTEMVSESRRVHMDEVNEILEVHRADLDVLYGRFNEADDTDLAIAIQKEIQELHHATEILVREANLRHARRLGMMELVAHLENDIKRLKERDRIRHDFKPENTRD
jgi:hypothetical protein